jgi:hypothetical protein
LFSRKLGSWVRILLTAWMSVLCAFILCIGRDLMTGWSPFQWVLPTVCRSRNWKSGQGPTNDDDDDDNNNINNNSNLMTLWLSNSMCSSWWNENLRGNPNYSEEIRPSTTLFATNSTWYDPGSNLCRRNRKTATNLLRYGTALVCNKEIFGCVNSEIFSHDVAVTSTLVTLWFSCCCFFFLFRSMFLYVPFTFIYIYF